MEVCDLCCNAQSISQYSSFLVFASLCAFSCVNCPAVICLPNTILSCGETPLVKCGSRSFLFIIAIQPAASCLPIFLFSYYKQSSFHSIQLILCFQQGQWD